MKKILFVINNMRMGGIQKALIEMLKCVSKKYQIDIFCMDPRGILMEQIPSNINILPPNKLAMMTENSVSEARNLGIVYALLRIFFSIWTKLFGKTVPALLSTKIIGKRFKGYDVAVSYNQPINNKDFCCITNEVVMNCAIADRKVTFVHCDFESYGGNCKTNRKLYSHFDKIAVVSNSVGKKFKELLPLQAKKVMTVRNFYNIDNIYVLAGQNTVVYSKTAIVTVSRLSEEKGILRCIPIIKELTDEGFEFEWHIVGAGEQETLIQEAIKGKKLDDIIILHGEQENPYRFMKNATFLLVPSYHEAAPMVFNEAQVLGLPILTTNTLSAIEMVQETGIGWVCENTDDSIMKYLRYVLSLGKAELLKYRCTNVTNEMQLLQLENVFFK